MFCFLPRSRWPSWTTITVRASEENRVLRRTYSSVAFKTVPFVLRLDQQSSHFSRLHDRRTERQNGARRRDAQRDLREQVPVNQLFELRERDTGVQVQVSAHRHHHRVRWRRRPAGFGLLHFGWVPNELFC